MKINSSTLSKFTRKFVSFCCRKTYIFNFCLSFSLLSPTFIWYFLLGFSYLKQLLENKLINIECIINIIKAPWDTFLKILCLRHISIYFYLKHVMVIGDYRLILGRRGFKLEFTWGTKFNSPKQYTRHVTWSVGSFIHWTRE